MFFYGISFSFHGINTSRPLNSYKASAIAQFEKVGQLLERDGEKTCSFVTNLQLLIRHLPLIQQKNGYDCKIHFTLNTLSWLKDKETRL